MPFTFVYKYGDSVTRNSVPTRRTESSIGGTRISEDLEPSSQNGNEVVETIRNELNIRRTNEADVDESRIKTRLSSFFNAIGSNPAMNIIFQDFPYLVIRLFDIALLREINFLTSDTIFFAGKNVLIILAQCYKMKWHHTLLRPIKYLRNACNEHEENMDLNQI